MYTTSPTTRQISIALLQLILVTSALSLLLGAAPAAGSQLVCAQLESFPSANGPGVTSPSSTATCPAGTSLAGGICPNSGGVNWALHGDHTSGGTSSYTCTWGALKATGAGGQFNACAICAAPGEQLVCDQQHSFPSANGPSVLTPSSTASCPAGTSLTGGICPNSGGVNWAVHGDHTSGGTSSYTCGLSSLDKTGPGGSFSACALCAPKSTQLVCAPEKSFPSASAAGVTAQDSTATCPSGKQVVGGICPNSGGVNWVIHGEHTSGGTSSYTCAFSSLKATSAGGQYNACAICS